MAEEIKVWKRIVKPGLIFNSNIIPVFENVSGNFTATDNWGTWSIQHTADSKGSQNNVSAAFDENEGTYIDTFRTGYSSTNTAYTTLTLPEGIGIFPMEISAKISNSCGVAAYAKVEGYNPKTKSWELITNEVSVPSAATNFNFTVENTTGYYTQFRLYTHSTFVQSEGRMRIYSFKINAGRIKNLYNQ